MSDEDTKTPINKIFAELAYLQTDGGTTFENAVSENFVGKKLNCFACGKADGVL